MPRVTKPYILSAGALVIAAQLNSNFDVLYNLINGQLDSSNIADGTIPSPSNTDIDGGPSDATQLQFLDGGTASSTYTLSQVVSGGTS